MVDFILELLVLKDLSKVRLSRDGSKLLKTKVLDDINRILNAILRCFTPR